MKVYPTLAKSLSRSPLALKQPKTPRRSTAYPYLRSSAVLSRHSLAESTKSCFEGAVLSPDILDTPIGEGTSLRILSAPRSLHVSKKNHQAKPRFFIQTIRPKQRNSLLPVEHQARAFGARMLNWVQIIATPTADTAGTTLLLHFDNHRYLFGSVGEGIQRATVQRKIGLNKVEDIFMTGPVNWHNAGGLFGVILTVADIITTQREHTRHINTERKKKGKPSLENTFTRFNIHAGKNLAHLLATARRFVFRKGLPIQPHEVSHDPRASNEESNEPDWQDSNIKVWYVPVGAANSVKSPRKRDYEEMSSSDGLSPTLASPKTSKADELQVMEIVTQMFNSNWKMDALVETTLHKANLPAKLFVRDDKGHIQVYKGPLPGGDEEVPDVPVLVRQPWPASMHLNLPRTEPSQQSMCYIVKNHDRRGRFNSKEAERYGVPKVQYKLLTAGQNATGKDGLIVTPEMVLEETIPGQGFAVLDIPDVSYIEPLLNRPELSNIEIMKGIDVIFWILGRDVVSDPRLQDYMQKNASIRHIVCSGNSAPNMIALESAATQAYKLHSIDPDRFPIPHHTNELSLFKTSTTAASESYEVGRTGKTIQFAPQFLHQDDRILPFPDVRKLSASQQVSGVKDLAIEAAQKCSNPTFLAKLEKAECDIPNRDAEVITLGTGSALPSKYRNVSATLLRVPGFGNYLFDAGENTIGQLRRVFGDELPSVLRDLKVIWISHLHADHHLGTTGVIRAWNEETNKSNPSAKLLVAAHGHMHDWLREYADVEDFGYNRLSFAAFSQYDPSTKICKPRVFSPADTEAYGLQKIEACYVDHCHGALATVFTWPSGLKVAYSGDCRPSDGFVKIGHGTTLLIHESTFDDELQGDAIAKKHSTMGEAINVGRRMGARRVMLTHFSQRYQKLPIFEDNFEVEDDTQAKENAKTDEVILVAFDYMRVKLGEFRKAQTFLPAIQKLLENLDD